MASQWFIIHNGKRRGPFSSADLRNLVKKNDLLPTDMIWKSGMSAPVLASTAKGLFADSLASDATTLAGPSTQTPPPLPVLPSIDANPRSQATPPAPPQRDRFVSTKQDEFTDITHITHRNSLKVAVYTPNTHHTLQLNVVRSMRHSADVLSIACGVNSEPAALPFSKEPCRDATPLEIKALIVKCDNQSVHLKWAQQDLSEYEGIQTHWNRKNFGIHAPSALCWRETGRFDIGEEVLRQLCDAAVLKIRIVSQLGNKEPDESVCARFQLLCRQFYHFAYNETLYLESVSGESVSGGGCFIATAAMGDYKDPAVQSLTRFRDQVLLRSKAGRRLVAVYYKLSPPVARAMSGRPAICRAVRHLIVRPASAIADSVARSSSHAAE
jgi:hypothetical protein